MPTLLVIDSSPMTDSAVTRRLTRRFVELWQQRFDDGEVIYRDLGANPPPHPDALTLAAFNKPEKDRCPVEQEAVRYSDRLVDELLAADHVVVGSPMYNFTVTSGLKAWIDLVGRAGRTFDYRPSGPVGLLRDKQVFVVTARGGFYTGDVPAAALDFQESYLRAYFNFLGVDDIRFIHAEGQGIDGETARAGEEQAGRLLQALFTDGEVRRVA
ncbi:MAG: NAD(P)H-dependent oxidoreductase [Gammaproteobacteria bacterium]|jgi:FMN-dependent NADH-azoreductase